MKANTAPAFGPSSWRLAALAVLLVATCLPGGRASAQVDARTQRMLLGVVVDFQYAWSTQKMSRPGDGTPYYAEALESGVRRETGGTSVNEPLRLLGEATRVTWAERRSAPAGVELRAEVRHERGTSTWRLVMTRDEAEILQACFRVQGPAWSSPDDQPCRPPARAVPAAASEPPPVVPWPVPTPAPAPQVPRQPGAPTTSPPQPPASDACRRFPQLC